jgi:predicted acyl esterase
LYRDTPLRLAKNLRVPHKVTVGPWGHLYPHEATPEPAVGFLQEALQWWDHWLKGQDTAVMKEPPFRFYMMDSVRPLPYYAARSGRWIAESEWPSRRMQTQVFAVTADGLRAVGVRAPDAAEAALVLASPQSTGLAAGDWGSFGNPGDVPGDPGLDSFGSLEFDSEPLAGRCEILGNVRAILELAADRPQAFVAVRLIDVAADGTATSVARGFLNLTQRDGREAPAPLVPGTRYRVAVELTGTAYAFPAGHRIRMAICNAYWPIVWPSPQPVTLTLFTAASQLMLPVRPPEPNPAKMRALPEPVSASQSPATILRKGRVERTVSIDQITTEVSHRLYVDGGVFGDWGKFRLDDIGLEMGHVFERVYSIKPNEPNSARAGMTQTYDMGRGDWQVTLKAGAVMTSTESTFESNAWIEAYESDQSVFRREWRTSIPRNGL